jgi:hypothetical protein
MPWHEEMIADITAAFEAKDLGSLERWTQADAVFDWSRSMNDIRGVYHGLDGMEEALARFTEAWGAVTWKVVEVDELPGDRLLLKTLVSAEGRSSGAAIEARGAQVLTLRDRKIQRVTMYQNPDDALADVAEGEPG